MDGIGWNEPGLSVSQGKPPIRRHQEAVAKRVGIHPEAIDAATPEAPLGLTNGITEWDDGTVLSQSTIDKAGRVVIPKELRDGLHLEAGDILEMERSGECITLRPARDEAPLVKKHGIWVHRGGGILTVDDVDRTLHETREARDRMNAGIQK